MGYGLIEINNKQPYLLTLGYIELHKIKDHYKKLQRIFERTLMLIDEFHPEELAIESPFYGNNVQSMLKLGRAQGVAISAALPLPPAIIMSSPGLAFREKSLMHHLEELEYFTLRF